MPYDGIPVPFSTVYSCLGRSTSVWGCPRPGRTLSRRSLVLNLRLEVLIQGWQAKSSRDSTSLSISSRTRFSVSFIRPSTVTEPGVRPSRDSKNSGSAKDRRALPICFDRAVHLLAGLDGGQGVVVHAVVGYVQEVQQVVGPQLLVRTSRRVRRASLIQGAVDLVGQWL